MRRSEVGDRLLVPDTADGSYRAFVNILLVEPYYGGSHQAWADGYAASSAHDVRLITHPARFWKWRMHGAFLTLAKDVEALIRTGWYPDVILASSMMDVAGFAGAIRDIAPGVPIATYFHESQFTYPLSPADKVDFTYQMKNWVSAAVSDLVIFNSVFHRSEFRLQAEAFLNTFPDEKHHQRVAQVVHNAIVLPVGIDLSGLSGNRTERSGPPLVVWNQRWEHDKGPEELLEIVTGLIDTGVEFEMAMCGEVFVSVPPTFAEVTGVLGDRLIHDGFAERARYEELLLSAQVVLSTALQEFFGIGVVEAVAGGAHPVLPNRLVYPERIDALLANPEATLYESVDEAVALIINALSLPTDPALRQSARRYDWTVVASRYDHALEQIRSQRPESG